MLSFFKFVDRRRTMEDEKPKDEKPRRWGVVCAAFQCEAKKEKKGDGGINFHQFPITNPDLCDTWVKQCRIDFTDLKKKDYERRDLRDTEGKDFWS